MYDNTQIFSNRLFDIYFKVNKFATENDLELIGAMNVVALSGGADSTALLLYAKYLADKHNNTGVAAIHINHQLRGTESDRDEKFCRDLCEQLGIKLTVYRAGRAGYKIDAKVGSEDWARQLRYGFFEKHYNRLVSRVEQEGYRRLNILTAHTLNDQAETILFRMCRDTGAHLFEGINDKIQMFRRPFLVLYREETEDICRLNDIAWVTDSTNLETDYARNKIRNIVVPVLKEINSHALDHIVSIAKDVSNMYKSSISDISRVVEKATLVKGSLYLTEILCNFIKKRADSIDKMVTANLIAKEIGADIGTQTGCLIEDLAKQLLRLANKDSNSKSDLVVLNLEGGQNSKQKQLSISDRWISVGNSEDQKFSIDLTNIVDFKSEGKYILYNGDYEESVNLEVMSFNRYMENVRASEREEIFYTNAKCLEDKKLVLRSIESGDKIDVPFRSNSRVAKFLAGSPEAWRKVAPVVSDEKSGQVLWAACVGFNKKCYDCVMQPEDLVVRISTSFGDKDLYSWRDLYHKLNRR